MKKSRREMATKAVRRYKEGCAISIEAAHQLQEKEGPYYDRWVEGMVKYVDKLRKEGKKK